MPWSGFAVTADVTEGGEPELHVANPYLDPPSPLLASSPRMRVLFETIRGVARTDATVLVLGESGVGKNLVAQAIHSTSNRRSGPFVLVNCAALAGELLESELFGHEKGAFTGAYRLKPGRFEFAQGGTLCLDEIGEMPRLLQAKLLHVLQDLRFSRVGGRELIRADVRVIATTNRDLQVAMQRREFREDLYYRLNVVEIQVPPLRERPESIVPLATSFLSRFNCQYERRADLLPETVAQMTAYPWPGNVRELENFVRRLVVLEDPHRAHRELVARIERSGASRELAAPAPSRPADAASLRTAFGGALNDQFDLKAIARRAAREVERTALIEVLERVRWNRTVAARILKVSYKTLLTKLTECGIVPPKSSPPS